MARNKNLLFGAVFVLAIFASLALFQATFAQTPAPASKTGFEDICPRGEGIAKCVQQIYILALGLGSLVALLMIVLAGYRYMTAAGNAQQVESAKEAFASAFIGLIVIFVAFILLYLINPDLVKFRGLSFPGREEPAKGGDRLTFGGAGEEEVFFDLQALLGNENVSLDQATGVITVTDPQGTTFALAPDLTSSLPVTMAQTLQAMGYDPSRVTIAEYNVSDPSLLPDSWVAEMGGKRPSRLLIVTNNP